MIGLAVIHLAAIGAEKWLHEIGRERLIPCAAYAFEHMCGRPMAACHRPAGAAVAGFTKPSNHGFTASVADTYEAR